MTTTLYNIELINKVIDGDTLDLIVNLGLECLKKERIRLYNVDCYETRTRDLKEKEKGRAAKAFTENWVKTHTNFTLNVIKRGKYGRLIADLLGYKNNKQYSLAEELLKNNHAIKKKY